LKVRRFTETRIATPVANTFVPMCSESHERIYLRVNLCAGVTAQVVYTTNPSTPPASAPTLFIGTGTVVTLAEWNSHDEPFLVFQQWFVASLSVGIATSTVTVWEVFEEDTGNSPRRSSLYQADNGDISRQLAKAGDLTRAAANVDALMASLRRQRL
jgi:hypothetical protein